MPETRNKENICSEAANRLLSMTRDIDSNYSNITKYKRARQQVLEQIKQKTAGVNYIGHQIEEGEGEQTIGSGGEYVLK
jgi:hypothetical protein